METIVCKYSCKKCGLHRISVKVPIRGEEDVVTWLKNVAAVALGQDHFLRSPNCITEKLDEVMIPITGADKIGGPAIN